MPEVWELAAVGAAVLLATGLVLRSRRPGPAAVEFTDEREERLTRRLAAMVRCAPEQALPAVRREIDIAPGQSDETLLKRAAYHYRQDLPEKTCTVYRDRAPG
jgi:hypothetical protein